MPMLPLLCLSVCHTCEKQRWGDLGGGITLVSLSSYVDSCRSGMYLLGTLVLAHVDLVQLLTVPRPSWRQSLVILL